MTDEEFLKAQQGVLLLDRARKAIEARRWTDRPGSAWRLDDVRLPVHFGVHAKARIFATDTGDAFEVRIYDYAGNEFKRATRKGLDAAFTLGQLFAAQPLTPQESK